MDDPEREILEGVASGDESACSALIRHVEPFVQSVLRTRRFACPDDRDDVAQVAYREVLVTAPKFDPGRGNFRALVWGVLRNVYNSYVRDRSRRPEIPFADLAEDFEPAALDPEFRGSEPSDLLRAFRAVYGELDQDDRAIVDHIIRHGVGVGTHKDLALELGISEAAAKQRVHRMPGRLVKMIEKELAEQRYPATKNQSST